MSEAPTVRKVLSLLQGILQRAVEWQRIPTNPVKAVKKPSVKKTSLSVAFGPETVEKLRASMPRLRDATLISVIAYAGLRPGEALALTWGDVRERSLLVTKAVSLGEEKETKTGRSRTVPLLRPLAQDLNEWRLACGRPGDLELVFPAAGGGHWEGSRLPKLAKAHLQASGRASEYLASLRPSPQLREPPLC